MTTTIRRFATLPVLLLVVTIVRAGDEPLTRVQIARIGKAATALVEVKAASGQGHASAFCIHPDGWFLTNAHVAQGGITLVLNPSLKTQKVYMARVVRSDSNSTWRSCRSGESKDLPALALGSDEGLEEQMDAMAFSFPLVENRAPGRKEYPAISVTAEKHHGPATQGRTRASHPARRTGSPRAARADRCSISRGRSSGCWSPA